MQKDHWVFLDTGDEIDATRIVRYGSSLDHQKSGKKLSKSVKLRRTIGSNLKLLKKFEEEGKSTDQLPTFSVKPSDEVMYDAVIEEDEEDAPDHLVSRLTRVIHDQKCMGPPTLVKQVMQ